MSFYQQLFQKLHMFRLVAICQGWVIMDIIDAIVGTKTR